MIGKSGVGKKWWVLAAVLALSLVVAVAIWWSWNANGGVDKAVADYEAGEPKGFFRLLSNERLSAWEREAIQQHVRNGSDDLYDAVLAKRPQLISWQVWKARVDAAPYGVATDAIMNCYFPRLSIPIEKREDYMARFLSGQNFDLKKAPYACFFSRGVFIWKHRKAIIDLLMAQSDTEEAFQIAGHMYALIGVREDPYFDFIKVAESSGKQAAAKGIAEYFASLTEEIFFDYHAVNAAVYSLIDNATALEGLLDDDNLSDARLRRLRFHLRRNEQVYEYVRYEHPNFISWEDLVVAMTHPEGAWDEAHRSLYDEELPFPLSQREGLLLRIISAPDARTGKIADVLDSCRSEFVTLHAGEFANSALRALKNKNVDRAESIAWRLYARLGLKRHFDIDFDSLVQDSDIEEAVRKICDHILATRGRADEAGKPKAHG